VDDIKLQPEYGFDRGLFERRIRDLAAERDKLKVLDAGCGRRWRLSLEGINYHLTGIDSDEQALRARREQVDDLDEWFVADLRVAELEKRSYDVIYCSFVLEHVVGAREILDRFVVSLRPGGLLLLRIPDRDSVYGFLTRITPFWVHVLYRRWVTGHKTAGKLGHEPYPTVYDKVVSRAGIASYCADNGFEVLDEYGSDFYLKDIGRWRLFVGPLVKLIGALSFGRLTARHNNLSIVLRKGDSCTAEVVRVS
jgi:SAM-dependent methyltransferase